MSDEKCLSTIVEPLLCWYRKNKRSLPWREAPSPYHVWISEIMLQQTRIETVKEYYLRFLEKMPSVRELAEADDDELLKLWEGLGYYSRARNLKAAAVLVMDQYDGLIPSEVESLKKLPGIGPYTAGAIASIAFGLPEPAVDGNVLRVLMRYQNRDDDVMKGKVRKETENTLRNLMRESFETGGGKMSSDPGDFTEALMELGEVICLPGSAVRCEGCPLKKTCLGYRAGRAGELPTRKASRARRVEKRTVFRIIDEKGRMLIRRRPDTGLLAGMWELPSCEGHIKNKEVGACLAGCLFPTSDEKEDVAFERSLSPANVRPLAPARHLFSHIEWNMIGYELILPIQDMVGWVWAAPQDLEKKYALATAFSAYSLHE